MHSWFQAARRTQRAAQCISSWKAACGSIQEAKWRKCQNPQKNKVCNPPWHGSFLEFLEKVLCSPRLSLLKEFVVMLSSSWGRPLAGSWEPGAWGWESSPGNSAFTPQHTYTSPEGQFEARFIKELVMRARPLHVCLFVKQTWFSHELLVVVVVLLVILAILVLLPILLINTILILILLIILLIILL
jgi:hypothetical protein